jgi:hypothetical protein
MNWCDRIDLGDWSTLVLRKRMIPGGKARDRRQSCRPGHGCDVHRHQGAARDRVGCVRDGERRHGRSERIDVAAYQTDVVEFS